MVKQRNKFQSKQEKVDDILSRIRKSDELKNSAMAMNKAHEVHCR